MIFPANATAHLSKGNSWRINQLLNQSFHADCESRYWSLPYRFMTNAITTSGALSKESR